MSIKINKNIVFLALLSLLSIINLFAQKENYISIVVPEEEVTTTTYSRYRLAANTLPGSSVSINGENIKVYPSGAFVDLLKLNYGNNEFKIKSTKNGISVNKQFTIIREDKSLKTTSTSELIIEDELMLPEDDLWLDAGDILEVRFKGTPGCKAYFMDGIEMTELPASENNGVEGIYTGIYTVRDNTNYD
ncbi:MAG: hypothetical protein KDC52_11000, partial [Ignavibacteriae bacterium]|nr:hypothetical protein [Ignavibacteriota bacterium]